MASWANLRILTALRKTEAQSENEGRRKKKCSVYMHVCPNMFVWEYEVSTLTWPGPTYSDKRQKEKRRKTRIGHAS